MLSFVFSWTLAITIHLCPVTLPLFEEMKALPLFSQIHVGRQILGHVGSVPLTCSDPLLLFARPYLVSYGDGLVGARESYYGYFGQERVPLFWYRRLPLVPVLGVMDGDTVEILYEGKKERIRMIGVDTPESVHPSKPVECFGLEASHFTKKQLTGAWVYFEGDTTQSRRDHYGRLLGYLYRRDGVLYNELLIREGYAHEYTYGKGLPYRYQQQFQRAERIARVEEKGLWNPTTCDGKD